MKGNKAKMATHNLITCYVFFRETLPETLDRPFVSDHLSPAPSPDFLRMMFQQLQHRPATCLAGFLCGSVSQSFRCGILPQDSQMSRPSPLPMLFLSG